MVSENIKETGRTKCAILFFLSATTILSSSKRMRDGPKWEKTVRGCTDKTRETEHIGNASNQQLVFLSNQERNAK